MTKKLGSISQKIHLLKTELGYSFKVWGFFPLLQMAILVFNSSIIYNTKVVYLAHNLSLHSKNASLT